MTRRRKKRKRKAWAAAALEQLVADGRELAVPDCRYQESCGGCTWQRVRYERQLEWKREFIRECFARVSLDDDVAFPLPRSSPELYGYRNHVELSFSSRRWLTDAEVRSGETFDRDFALGLHAPGGFGRVIDMDSCSLQRPLGNRIRASTRAFARGSSRPSYDPVSHEGFWRYLSVRTCRGGEEALVLVVTRERDAELMARYAAHLAETVGSAVTSVVNGVTESVADTSMGAELHLVAGTGTIVEEVGGLSFSVSADSFFQPNTPAAALLFALVNELADPAPALRVVDLFCGAGTLSLGLARSGAQVVGYEVVEAAVDCARENARRNGIGGCAFEVADLGRGLPELAMTPDVVVTDPPRAGMHPRLLADLVRLRAPRIVSVGCNPMTQAENLAVLCGAGYRIVRMESVDQFPHTPHVENVALLEL